LQQGGRVCGKEAGSDFDLVIQFGAGEQFEARTVGAALWVIGRVDEPGNPRLDDGPGTHSAGLEGDVENGAGEAVVTEEARGLPNDEDFRVRGGVIITIVRLPERARTTSLCTSTAPMGTSPAAAEARASSRASCI